MSEPLHHLTAKALPGTLLFHTWTEALELWRRLVAAFPDALAMCLMPNHPHVILPIGTGPRRLHGVMSGYARWRGHHRGTDSDCWQPAAPPELLPGDDPKRTRRNIRYVHLNACRGDLAGDPLAWPLSTHRDAVGFGDPKRLEREPARFHKYVSSDPKVHVAGTELPGMHRGAALLTEVEAAVGAVFRLEPHEVRSLPASRRVFVRAARICENELSTIGDWLSLGRTQVFEHARGIASPVDEEPRVQAVLRAIRDPRFASLTLPQRAVPTVWAGWCQRASYKR